MLRLFPVERANARVRTRRHAHAATDALIVVLTNRTGFRIFVRCSTGHTFTHAGFSQCWRTQQRYSPSSNSGMPRQMSGLSRHPSRCGFTKHRQASCSPTLRHRTQKRRQRPFISMFHASRSAIIKHPLHSHANLAKHVHEVVVHANIELRGAQLKPTARLMLRQLPSRIHQHARSNGFANTPPCLPAKPHDRCGTRRNLRPRNAARLGIGGIDLRTARGSSSRNSGVLNHWE